jgi:hypothetical protein
MNSKAEWHAPVVPRVVVTSELEDLEQQGGEDEEGEVSRQEEAEEGDKEAEPSRKGRRALNPSFSKTR